MPIPESLHFIRQFYISIELVVVVVVILILHCIASLIWYYGLFSDAVLSKQNSKFCTNKLTHCCPEWTSRELPQLVPILPEKDYLEEQHILLAVKTADNMESYGEFTLKVILSLHALM